MMNWRAAITAAFAIGLGIAGMGEAHAQAGAVDFSFATVDDGYADLSVSGVVDGTLQSDGNIFDVTGVSSLTVNGAPISLAGWMTESFDVFFGESPDAAAISLDGSYLNLSFDGPNSANVGFAVGDEVTVLGPYPTVWGMNYVYYGSFFAGDYQWSASFAAIPEPASLAALMVGMMAVGTVRRRRTR
jgi:hypothetical protein